MNTQINNNVIPREIESSSNKFIYVEVELKKGENDYKNFNFLTDTNRFSFAVDARSNWGEYMRGYIHGMITDFTKRDDVYSPNDLTILVINHMTYFDTLSTSLKECPLVRNVFQVSIDLLDQEKTKVLRSYSMVDQKIEDFINRNNSIIK